MHCISNSIVKESTAKIKRNISERFEGPACKLTIYSCLSFRFQTASRETQLSQARA